MSRAVPEKPLPKSSGLCGSERGKSGANAVNYLHGFMPPTMDLDLTCDSSCHILRGPFAPRKVLVSMWQITVPLMRDSEDSLALWLRILRSSCQQSRCTRQERSHLVATRRDTDDAVEAVLRRYLTHNLCTHNIEEREGMVVEICWDDSATTILGSQNAESLNRARLGPKRLQCCIVSTLNPGDGSCDRFGDVYERYMTHISTIA